MGSYHATNRPHSFSSSCHIVFFRQGFKGLSRQGFLRSQRLLWHKRVNSIYAGVLCGKYLLILGSPAVQEISPPFMERKKETN